ncbi:MAG: GerW family sporulation protein [Bacillota bacterium]|jgi:uncharacterized spore protein YtfJ
MENLKSLGERLENLISSKTVIGEPIVMGKVTLVPIIRANFGFGMGGGRDENQSGASGGGGGAQIIPVAVVVVGEDNSVSILPVDKAESGGIGQLVESLLPQLMSKLSAFRKGKEQAEVAAEPAEPMPPEQPE